jgi:ribonuclease PH
VTFTRADGRAPDEPRPVMITVGAQPHAEGSALIEVGGTHVLCAASVSDGVPRWRRGSGLGWVTAEYGMLPRATHTRSPREARLGRQGGRSQEIQRLIGRALRAVTDMSAMGERTVTVDCDVISADGGTRTAAITGGYVALHTALAGLVSAGTIDAMPLREPVAATSLGYVHGELLLDLAYDEDSAADSDFNIVMTGSGRFIEFQGSAEAAPFDTAQLDAIVGLARRGVEAMMAAQDKAPGD